MFYCCCCNVFDNEALLFSFTKVPHSFIRLLHHHHSCCSVIWLMQFYQQRIAITFADVFYPTRIRPQKLLRLREKDPEHNWMDVGGGAVCFITPFPPADRFSPLLPPQAGTNKTSTTLSRYKYHHVHFHSVANGPTFDPKHLQLYRSRAVCLVWRFGLRMVFNRLDTYTQQNEDI